MFLDRIPYGLAARLKEKGFTSEGNTFYARTESRPTRKTRGWKMEEYTRTTLVTCEEPPRDSSTILERSYRDTTYTAAPTYAEVFDWLNRKAGIAVITYRMTQFWRTALRSADNGTLIQDIRGDVTDPSRSWNENADEAIGLALEFLPPAVG